MIPTPPLARPRYPVLSCAMKYRPHPDLADKIASAGYTIRGFCQATGFPAGTLMAVIYPGSYPDRRGGMQARTAYRLARAWAQLRGIDEATAFKEVIVEEQAEQP
jgi:hypothetical protein